MMTRYLNSATGETVEFAAGSFYAEIADESPQWQSLDARPKRNAGRDEWVAFAIASGVPSYEAANLTRDQLIERMGDHPDVADEPPADASEIVTDQPTDTDEGDA